MFSGKERKEGFPIEQAHPAFRGKGSPLCERLDPENLAHGDVDLVFLATPHEISHHIVPALLDRGLRVIDLSGAFRLRDATAYGRWYGFEHQAPQALEEAVYGLTELNAAEVTQAQLVSNPGCYATSAILALAPLREAGWLDLAAGIVCDAKSGASGAGRSPSDKLHFPEVNENCRAYNLFKHRHVPEILQALELEERNLTFTPHLLPITRGILSTVYVRLAATRSLDRIVSLFRDFMPALPWSGFMKTGRCPKSWL
jgi:N-acetyl-gamma-glutamyl-phosphate reductase